MDEQRDVVVDADGHLCEPPRLWEDNLPPSMRDRALRLRWNAETGFDTCIVEDKVLTDRGLAGLGNAGTPYVNLGQGTHYEDLNPAGFDAHERLKVLDAEGIDVAVMYGGLSLKLAGIEDPELAVAHCRVYNDWLAEWCQADPERLIGSGVLPMQDPVAAAAEVHRIAGLGMKAGWCRPNPFLGRQLHHRDFDPVYEALIEEGLPLAFHPAGPWDVDGTSRRMNDLMAPGTHHATILFFDQHLTLSNFVWGGVLERHPHLKIGVLECGGGWVAHWMDRMDEFIESYGWQVPDLTLKPSEYFRRQCWVSFDPGERTAALLGDRIGQHTMIWASDFPHSDAKYPGVVDELMEHAEAMEPASRAGLVGLNALALYGLDTPQAAAAAGPGGVPGPA
jgi:uncharacterized protein